MSLVSIIIPMYLCEDYVSVLLKALCAQTYQDIEILCVIDGSSDHTLDEANASAEKDCRIRVLHQYHRGAGIARNMGLAAAQGEYVLFLDADDLYPENFVKTMAETAIRTKADITVCRYYKQNVMNGQTTPDHGFIAEKITAETMRPEEIDDILCTISSVPHNKLYRRSFVLENDLRFSETESINDLSFTAKSLISAGRIVFIPDNLYTYRKYYSKDSISSNLNAHLNDLFTVYEELYSWLVNKGLADRYSKTYCRKWRDSFYINASLGKNMAFVQKTAAYLAEKAPFADMDDNSLLQEAGLLADRLPVSRWIPWQKDPYTKLQQDNIQYNVKAIRRELVSRWGKLSEETLQEMP